jgi:hypothetical protein
MRLSVNGESLEHVALMQCFNRSYSRLTSKSTSITTKRRRSRGQIARDAERLPIYYEDNIKTDFGAMF